IFEAVAIEVHQDLAHLPAELEVDQHVLIDPVVVLRVVRSLLIRPRRFARIGIAREDRHRPLVLAWSLIGIPRAGVAGAVVEEIELGVVAVPAPRRAAATLPFLALPGFDRPGKA